MLRAGVMTAGHDTVMRKALLTPFTRVFLMCPLQIVACCVSEDAQDKLGGSQRPSYKAGVRDGWESVGG